MLPSQPVAPMTIEKPAKEQLKNKVFVNTFDVLMAVGEFIFYTPAIRVLSKWLFKISALTTLTTGMIFGVDKAAFVIGAINTDSSKSDRIGWNIMLWVLLLLGGMTGGVIVMCARIAYKETLLPAWRNAIDKERESIKRRSWRKHG